MKYEDINLIEDVRINGATGASGQAIGVGSTALNWIDAKNRLEGERYIFVHSKGTSVENGTRLKDAYDTAINLSPSDVDRITIGVMGGVYEFTDTFRVDTVCIDIVSLSGECDVFLEFPNNRWLQIANNDIKIVGINCDKIFIEGEYPDNVFINCAGGNSSFSNNSSDPFRSVKGTFIRCTGGDYSFGGNDDSVYQTEFLATAIDCTGGNYSFGGSIYSGGGGAIGTCIRCIGGESSFGTNVDVNGTFTNCTGGSGSFGAGGSFLGSLYYCVLEGSTFPTVDSGGKIIFCIENGLPATNQQ